MLLLKELLTFSLSSVSLIHILSLGSPEVPCSRGSLMISENPALQTHLRKEYNRLISTKATARHPRLKPRFCHMLTSYLMFLTQSLLHKMGNSLPPAGCGKDCKHGYYIGITYFFLILIKRGLDILCPGVLGGFSALKILLHHLRALSLLASEV